MSKEQEIDSVKDELDAIEDELRKRVADSMDSGEGFMMVIEPDPVTRKFKVIDDEQDNQDQ